MINVTVIKRKDAIKYLVRVSIIMVLFFILTRYFCNFKNTKLGEKIKKVDSFNMIACIENTIPQAKELKKIKHNNNNKETDNVKSVLKSELSIIDGIMEKQDVEVNKLSNTDASSIYIDDLNSKSPQKDNNFKANVEIKKVRNRCKNRSCRK